MNRSILRLVVLLLIPCQVTDVVGGNVIGDNVTPYHATTYHTVNDSPFEEQALAVPALGARMPAAGAHTKAAIARTAAAPGIQTPDKTSADPLYGLSEEQQSKLAKIYEKRNAPTRRDYLAAWLALVRVLDSVPYNGELFSALQLLDYPNNFPLFNLNRWRLYKYFQRRGFSHWLSTKTHPFRNKTLKENDKKQILQEIERARKEFEEILERGERDKPSTSEIATSGRNGPPRDDNPGHLAAAVGDPAPSRNGSFIEIVAINSLTRALAWARGDESPMEIARQLAAGGIAPSDLRAGKLPLRKCLEAFAAPRGAFVYHALVVKNTIDLYIKSAQGPCRSILIKQISPTDWQAVPGPEVEKLEKPGGPQGFSRDILWIPADFYVVQHLEKTQPAAPKGPSDDRTPRGARATREIRGAA